MNILKTYNVKNLNRNLNTFLDKSFNFFFWFVQKSVQENAVTSILSITSLFKIL